MTQFSYLFTFVSDMLLKPDASEDEVFKLDTGIYANVFIDSNQHIQVCMYSDENLEEEEDGGGLCMLWNDDPEDGYDCFEDDPENYQAIIESQDPEAICKLVTDKALFIWQLMHS